MKVSLALALTIIATLGVASVVAKVEVSKGGKGAAAFYPGLGPLNDLKLWGYNPKANPKAVTVSGSARFTVLSDYVIRMEYNPSGRFEDRATIMAVNRYHATVPSFTVSTRDGTLTIRAKYVTLSYQVGQTFSASSLRATIRYTAPQGQVQKQWSFGDYDNGNLFGTVRSLDELCTISLNCTKNKGTIIHRETLHCAPGVASTNGWTTIDDADNYIMDETQWFSVLLNNTNAVDTYLFGHGLDFKAALLDYRGLSGKIPIPVQATHGSWWTRWYDYDNHDLDRLIGIFEKESIPLDTLILDMNWHTKNAWGGFTWDRELFGYPHDTIDMIHSKGLYLGVNIHDCDGMNVWEDTYSAFCDAMGVNPASNVNIPFAPLNKTYMRAMEDITLTNSGQDFWWTDWQQGGNAGGCPGNALNPTLITDHVRGTDNARRGNGKRDQNLARWGGLGSHRYPWGFSGDVSQLSWECFAYQPYFSATAANVGYSWSHDLVGPPNDHELHVRWIQFGAYSSVMRMHDRGMSAGSCWKTGTCGIVNVWRLPFPYFDAIREAMTDRVALLPYIYSYHRKTYETGVTLVHPMYYEWPFQSGAYTLGPDGKGAQYYFGDDIIVAPITFAGDATTQLATKTVWLPPGKWYHNVFGCIIEGGNSWTGSFDVSETPVFIRAGAVIPRLRYAAKVGVASQRFEDIDVYVYPAATSGNYTMYEDDGKSTDYVQGAYATTSFAYTVSQQKQMTFTADGLVSALSPPAGKSTRRLRLIVVNGMPIASANVNGQSVAYQRYPAEGASAPSWYYDGKKGHTIVSLGASPWNPTGRYLDVSITFSNALHQNKHEYVKGYAARATLAKRVLDNVRETPDSVTVGAGYLKRAGAQALDLSYLAGTDPSLFSAQLNSYHDLMTNALQSLGPNPPTLSPSQQPGMHGLVQMWNRFRNDMCLCGSADCISTNSDYEIMWVEGYQPLPSDPNAIPFYDFYSSANTDNWGTATNSAPQSGYEPAVFSNGYVTSNTGGQTKCLQLWYNSATQDHMVTGSDQGLTWATVNGYTQVQACVAHALLTPPVGGEEAAAKAHATKRLEGGAYYERATQLLGTVVPSP